MKVVAFNGSPRRNGNTAALINHVFSKLRSKKIEAELVQLGGKSIQGCTACYKCLKDKNKKCTIKDDILNECVAKMLEADAVVLGSPTYFANVTSEMKALIDRAGLVAIANGHMLKRKVGAAVVAVRRAGAIHAFNSMNHFFLINQMVVPGSSYWNLGIGRNKGEVEGDTEGITTMKTLGANIAWTLKKLRS